MSIAGFIPNPETATLVVAWVQALADEGEEIKFLCLETRFDGGTSQAVRESLGEQGDSVTTVTAIDDPLPIARVREHVRKRGSRLLVTAPFTLPALGGKAQTTDELVRTAPCRTFAVMYGGKTPSELRKVLFVPTGSNHDRPALRIVDTLRQHQGVQVTIGTIEAESGAQAGRAGQSYIRSLLHEEALDEQDFEVKVVVDRQRPRGVMALYEGHDLVVTGADAISDVHSLQQSLRDPTVAIVRRTPPLRRHAMADWLPRINPADHADLRYSLRFGSNWGPDFVGMLGMASAIASLGLLQNSPAVVIGSMLLAPLMTPMIGLGLALGQADVQLARQCGKSIGLGFLLTLAVSILVGIITPAGETLTDEVLARGGPNVLDLLIAVFAAAAATFAMARPNISGAIAGVAIATALVPPVCAVGISLTHGAWLNAFGATTLFFTNLIAIIVMSSFTFLFLGITASGASARYRRRAVAGRWGLVLLLLALVGPLSTTLIAQLEEGKHVPVAYPVTKAVARAVHERVSQDEDVHVIFLARPRAEDRVVIHISSLEELPPSYANELRKIVRDQMDDPELPVSVIAVRGQWHSDSDSPENGSP